MIHLLNLVLNASVDACTQLYALLLLLGSGSWYMQSSQPKCIERFVWTVQDGKIGKQFTDDGKIGVFRTTLTSVIMSTLVCELLNLHCFLWIPS